MSPATLFDEICEGAERESGLWAESLRPLDRREPVPVFSPLVPDPAQALGLETIYEGYLLHYGRSRLFAPTDQDIALLLGDTLLAHGLVRIAELGDVVAVGDLAQLLSLCAQARAADRDGEAAAWAATAAHLGRGGIDAARAALRDLGEGQPLEAAARSAAGDAAVEAALAAHRRFVS
jgi:hypothetical protein